MRHLMPPQPPDRPGFAHMPILGIPLDVWIQLRTYILRCPTEINGFGLVKQLEEDNLTFLVEELIVLKQKATATHVEIDEKAMTDLLYDLTVADKEHMLRMQWHSHVGGNSYFSGTDLANIERYPGNWMISVVMNHRNELEARFDALRPFRYWSPMAVKIWVPEMPTVTAKVDDDIRRHVRRAGLPMFKPGLRELPDDGHLVGADSVEVDL